MTDDSNPPATARRQFLLCRGGDQSGGDDNRSLLSVFLSEGQARAAFRRLRAGEPRRTGWAELAAVDERGRLTVMAWFGRPAPPLTADVIAWSTASDAEEEPGAPASAGPVVRVLARTARGWRPGRPR